MKNQFIYLFIAVTLISCSDNVKFNNSALEGQKDNVFWRAIDAKASVVNGVLTIEGSTKNEKLTLVMPSPTTKVTKSIKNSYVTYALGTSTTKVATYIFKDANGSVTFSTGVSMGNGQIVITGYDGVNNIVSGTFKFNAENLNSSPIEAPPLNFQYGNFYIPLK